MTKPGKCTPRTFEEMLKEGVPQGVSCEESLLPLEDEKLLNLPLFEEEDCLILLHKEVHFYGSFSAMIDYYSDLDAKGISDEIDPRRIRELSAIEEKLGINLAATILSSSEAEKVAFFRKMYEKLSLIIETSPSSFEATLSEAILSQKPVEDVVEEYKDRLTTKPKLLLSLATSDTFTNNLSPGYGTAPSLAIILLGLMKHSEAVSPLFSLLGQRDFMTENAILWAVHEMGEPAKQFALQRLQGTPLTQDNERAALILLEFLPDSQVESAFKEILLLHPNIHGNLRDYLSLEDVFGN